MIENLLKPLEVYCGQLQLELGGDTLVLLCRYVRMLEKWNRAYNLTAIRDVSAMLTHHLLDSLVVDDFLSGEKLLDVGTGAGLPGIPLAIVNPDRHFCLLDSNGKKTRFLCQLVAELELKNVRVEQQRAEHLVDYAGFSMILSRAFANLAEMLAVTDHLLARRGQWLAMKGTHPSNELATLPPGIAEPEIYPVQVPGLEAERHIVILQRQDTVS